jgi:F-type H+-transporting ATPase subunit a
MAAGHSNDVFHHVRDSTAFEVPRALGGEWHIPQPFGDLFPITKFMVLEVVAALIVFAIFHGLARKAKAGEPVRGRFWNFWEALALFIRDEVVRPTIGEGHAHDVDHAAHDHETQHHHGANRRAGHPADKYLPFIWSLFFFILVCNLLGAIPWLGSPTGSLWMTGVLAVCTFVTVVRAGMSEVGPVGFWKMVPKMDLPFALAIFLVPLMWVIEFIGLIIKHGVLAVRLFANIMAGHTVIAVILGFIAAVGSGPLYYVVAPASVFGQVGIGLLELFVAFLKAYVFVYLATVFISMATHPH